MQQPERPSIRFTPDFTTALLGFSSEAGAYCQGISDPAAQQYATEYSRMLQNRAKGIQAELPRIPNGLFQHNRNLIRATLERIWTKCFAGQ